MDAAARRCAWMAFTAALAAGAAAALFYAHRGLTLSHYDARGHLVVARRLFDSLTPGWRQLGAVWLPLPHLLNAIPVASDWAYRTGSISVALSVLELAAGLGLMSGYLRRVAGSTAAALLVPALVLVNPDVLYLQSTPMTEPLLFGLSLASVVAVDRWLTTRSVQARQWAMASLAALVLTRYEGWCIAAALIGVAGLAGWREWGRPALPLVAAVAVAVTAFLFLSWASTGQWFITSGFFVADNPARHRPWAVTADIVRSLLALAGPVLVAAGIAGVIVLGVAASRDVRRLLPVALVAAVILPFGAFYDGHPLRIRYMVPLVVACGILAPCAIAALPRRLQAWAAVALLACVAVQRPPLDAHAPMVLEAQWETPYRQGREIVTRYLDEAYDGTPILASMGSLGHYMQDTAWHGLDLANFLHEGNGDLWIAALRSPRRYVRWILIEERAEGGDELAARASADPSFLAGFTRVADGGGLALYRRTADAGAAAIRTGSGTSR